MDVRSKAFTEVNTIKFMNGVEDIHMIFHLLRVLHTDDGLTAIYMLLEHSTIRDIVHMCGGILNDVEEVSLTEQQLAEFTDLCNNLKVYAGDMV